MTGAAIGIGAGLAAAGTAIAGGAMAVKGTKPRKQFFGNTPEQEAAYRAQYETGVQQGNVMTGQGAGMMGNAGQYAQGNRALGLGMYGQGQALTDQGIARQQGFLKHALITANMPQQSVGALQMQQGADMTSRAMMAQAASARGGNQAAAMRGAQATGAQMGLESAQQAAQIRAGEENARVDRILQTQAMAAQMSGQQSQLGAGMQGQALAQANQAAGIYGQMGQSIGQLGLGSQGQFLDARTSMETAALNADVQVAQAKAAAQADKRRGLLALGGSLIGAGGSVMGSGMGGGK